MKPNFIMIGAAKAATTSICHTLSLHPQIHVTPTKDLNYFSRLYDSRPVDWYYDQFQPSSGEIVSGEGSPQYAFGDASQVPARIAKHLPDVKLIYFLRHPIVRLESHYSQFIDNGFIHSQSQTFTREIRNRPELFGSSLYWQRLSAFRDYFDDSQIHVAFYEDFKADPKSELDRCMRFIGVDPELPLREEPTTLNRSADHTQDTPLMHHLRKLDFLFPLASRLPDSTKAKLKKMLRKPVSLNIEWDETTWQWAIRQIEPDSEKVLEYCGKSKDYWHFARPNSLSNATLNQSAA